MNSEFKPKILAIAIGAGLFLSIPSEGQYTGAIKFANSKVRSNLPIAGNVSENVGLSVWKESDVSLQAISQLGIRWIRFPVNWKEMVVADNLKKYRWTEYCAYLNKVEQNGLSALIILDDFHYLVNSAPPILWPPATIAAFAEHADSIARHNKIHHPNLRVMYEIWNEPTGIIYPTGERFTWDESMLPLVNLTKAAAEKINAIGWEPGKRPATMGPSAHSITGSSGGELLYWFNHYANQVGGLAFLDAYAVHPYFPGEDGDETFPQLHPELIGPDYERIRTTFGILSDVVPIVSTEWGYAWDDFAFRDKYFVDSQERHAAYMARTWLFNIYCGIPLSFWFTWRDVEDVQAGDHNCGLVYDNYDPNIPSKKKKAFWAAKAFLDHLGGTWFQRRDYSANTTSDNLSLYVLRFYEPQSGKENLALWTADGTTRTITLPSPTSGTFVTIDYQGVAGVISASSNGLTITVGPTPLYVKGVPYSGGPATPDENTRNAIYPLLGGVESP